MTEQLAQELYDSLIKFYGTDWLAMCCTFMQLHLLASKNPLNFVFGILATLSWGAFGVMAGSLAGPIANIIFLTMNLIGLYKWLKSAKTA